MCLCFLCSDKPHPDDKFGSKPNKFQVGMCGAACKEPCCCIGQFIFPCCVQYALRKEALDDNMSEYICCQGYVSGCCCCKPGHLGEKRCPGLCLCIEVTCFNSCAVSSTRAFVMDKYNLQSDPWDRRIIRLNNCIQMLACICNILAIVNENLRECSKILDCVAQCVYLAVSGCMTAQTHHECKFQKKLLPPQSQKMDRNDVVAEPVGTPYQPPKA